jgi:RNA polymerase sigma-70 factor, ECF subfamily
MPSSSDTSLSLLRRAQQDDPEAWLRIVHLYGPLVLFWCRRAGLSEHDAQDVCQETFGAVARALPKFHRDRSGDTFRGWLRTVTSRKLADFARRRTKEPKAVGGTDYQNFVAGLPVEPPASSAIPMPDDVLSQGDRRDQDDPECTQEAQICRRALDFIRSEFEERTWRAFWRTAIDGQNATEVAQELETTSAAVRKAKSRVLSRLRAELEGLVELD